MGDRHALRGAGRAGRGAGDDEQLHLRQRQYQYYETICGGTGAGPDFDGTSAVHTHMTNSRLTDPEVLEWRYPVLLESHRIRSRLGRQGHVRGGDGTIRRVRFLEPMTAAILSNHRQVPPFGLHGGEPGSPGDQWIERADGTRSSSKAAAGRRSARRRVRHPDPERGWLWPRGTPEAGSPSRIE